MRTRSRAQSIVEFAVILPVMLVLVLGMIDLGRALMFGVAVQNGAREAARVAANAALNPGIATSEVIQRLIDASGPALTTCTAGASDVSGCPWHVTISPSTISSSSSGSAVTVTIANTSDISFFAGRLTGAMGLSLTTFTIQGSASMVIL